MRSDDPAASHLQELIDGFWPIHVLTALVKLELPDAMAGSPADAGELAQRLGLDPSGVFRLLRAASALGVCEDLGDRRFALTDAGTLLRGDVEGSLRGDVFFYGAVIKEGFADIPEVVRTGRAGHSVTPGPEGFDLLAEEPERLDAMHRTMIGSSRDVAEELCRIYDFGAHRTLVDVGGGYGGLLAAVLQSNPHLTGAVFDLPSVERGAMAYLESQDLSGRAGYTAGSFFDHLPPPADCYLLKYIIHDWDDERARQILTNCRRGAGADGVILVIDRLLPERFANVPEHRQLARADMTMMGYGGQERSEQEMFTLLHAARLRPVRIVGRTGGLSVVEARAA
jgi:orsellinic acid C2-O-methyltransferase